MFDAAAGNPRVLARMKKTPPFFLPAAGPEMSAMAARDRR